MFEVGTMDFAVYEDGDEFVGIASVKLPEKVLKQILMNGAGIGGDVNVPIEGQYDAMQMELRFRNYSERVARLREHRRHNIDLRIAQQNEDPVAGQLVVDSVKHLFVVVPLSQSGGEVAPATSSNTTIVFSVRYWSTGINGKKVEEIDQLNRINFINGIDYNEPVRRALGK